MQKNCQDLNANSSFLKGALPGTGLSKASCAARYIAEIFSFEVLYWAQMTWSEEVEGTEHNVGQEGEFRQFMSLFLNTRVSN